MRSFVPAVVLALASLLPLTSAAGYEELADSFSSVEQVGSANVGFLGFRLYKAELWAEDDENFALDYDEPFALSLTYEREFSLGQLLTSTVKEMSRIEDRPEKDFYPLRAKLSECWDDVMPGDRITAKAKGEDMAIFYLNGERSCEIEDPAFSERFFGIWLGEKTRDRRSRNRLLGAAQ
ncbi:MAG: chalcone isomerase family protein [Pseudomonadota bacterium]